MAYFDTHEAVEMLISKGVTKEQAEAFTEICNKRNDDLVTKIDLNSLSNVLKSDISLLQAELKTVISESKSEMIKWFVGSQLATIAIILTVISLFIK